MLITTSISGKTIRLPEERWIHIVERHPEMAGHLEDVLSVVAAPILLLKGGNDELLAAAKYNERQWLVVVYKENELDGFILTAYLTSKTEKLFNRIIIWQK